MSDKELIKICLLENSRKSGYENFASLRQRDLGHLSAEIEKRTGVLLSISTIRRLLNAQFNHLPQAATLNAITAYLGYQSWQEFRKIKQQEIDSANALNPLRTGHSIQTKKRTVSYRVLLLLL